MPKGSTNPPVKHLTWVYVSAAAFLISMAGAVYFVTTISKTAAAGIAGQLYYIILIPLEFGRCKVRHRSQFQIPEHNLR